MPFCKLTAPDNIIIFTENNRGHLGKKNHLTTGIKGHLMMSSCVTGAMEYFIWKWRVLLKVSLYSPT